MKDYNLKVGTIAMSLPDLKGIGPAFIKKVLTPNSFQSSNLLEAIKSITDANNKSFDEDIILGAIEKAKEIVNKCNEENITIIELTSDDYPATLREIKDPPPILYCKGNLELLYQKTICIIGTREPNEHGAKIAERIGAYFSNSNWTICNGLAEGIDNCSIKTNEKLHNKIIGVLAGGLNYNTSKTLLKKTAENAEKTFDNGGLLVSENPPDKKEDTFSVVKSCRIQSGLSHGLIIVQSSIDGGSRFTTKAFCETQRPLAIIQPIQLDYELPTYAANKEIIENKKKGLAKFTELKEEKILTKTIFVIKSKDDYQTFENIAGSGQKSIEQPNTTLF